MIHGISNPKQPPDILTRTDDVLDSIINFLIESVQMWHIDFAR